jgi:hypothetical protein
MRYCVCDVDGTEIRRVSEDVANNLFVQGVAEPIGNRRNVRLKLRVNAVVAMPLLSDQVYPINQASRTYRRVLIVDRPVYEHRMMRCLHWYDYANIATKAM